MVDVNQTLMIRDQIQVDANRILADVNQPDLVLINQNLVSLGWSRPESG
jgi:hypothetical protein